ncbi:MAG: response regulator [candidate division Zixibacteria bacterium]|nr:response regulator [candidate division Zixibacteria bacterium]
MARVMLVDDEVQFRESMAKRLKMRGYDIVDVGTGEEAIKIARNDSDLEVAVLDLKMPGMSGDQVLKDIKEFRPALQVIMLTGHGSVQSAMEIGRLDAFRYLEKPCDIDKLVEVIEEAREAKVHAMERHEIPRVIKGSRWKWLVGSHNHRPGVILLGLLLFALIAFGPTPDRMLQILSAEKTGQLSDPHQGYSGYSKMEKGTSIAKYYGEQYKVGPSKVNEKGKRIYDQLTPKQTASRAKIMLGILVVAALFWASGAVPIGITAILVGVGMYFLGVLRPDDIAKAYAKDAVIFIFGVLAISIAISKTGLDRRIGLLLLSPAKNLRKLLFIFLPLLGVACSFVSEHALIAFVMPLFMMVYAYSTREANVKQDRALAVMFALSLCFVANCGGPGSPAAGGRNAVMLGILADYGIAPSFGEWVVYGLPYVPVMALVIATYFFFMFRKKIKVKQLDVSSIVKRASEKIGPMNSREYITAAVLVGLILLWITTSDIFGMGGPVLLAIVLLNIFKILRWKDIATIPWDVVALYASAAALGKGLAVTGAALYLADSFISILPSFMQSGEGLAIATSLFTGITTNFMSDGATVSAIGPITVPMASISGTHPWMVGLATAFASSFAHMMIIGTPNNAIAYTLAKDPVTGEQLVKLSDFLKHGAAILVLSLIVMWFWVFLGYWRFVGFPS